MRFLDANVFVRHLTGDIPEQTDRCARLFERLRTGEEEATTSEAVIAEVVFVLSSSRLYGVDRERIRRYFQTVLPLRGIALPHLDRYLRAFDLYAAHRIDFEDALTVAQVEDEGLEAVYSFDRDFDRIPTVSRVEP